MGIVEGGRTCAHGDVFVLGDGRTRSLFDSRHADISQQSPTTDRLAPPPADITLPASRLREEGKEEWWW